MIKEQLILESKAALKSGNEFELGVLRLLTSALHNREIEKKTKGENPLLTEDEVIQLLQTEAKKRREAADLFRKGGRNDLAEKEERENRVIARYLPSMLAGEKLEHAVYDVMERAGAADFPAAMKAVMAELRGKADAKVITELVRRKFSS